MYSHHEETIKNISDKLRKRDDVLGLLIGGSIAHGYETETSDVDIMILISSENYKIRLETGDLCYWENESCTYKDGYIDGKYITFDFMQKVAERGSEPARFAFDGSIVAFSKLNNLKELINQITRYPFEKKRENIKRFYAQLEAWKWYYYEALRHKNEYLLNQSISNIVLFGGRLILVHNELLYPYHKWFLRTLEKAKCKPDNFMQLVENIYTLKDNESFESFCNSIMKFTDWGLGEFNWPAQFIVDSELSWLYGNAPIADI